MRATVLVAWALAAAVLAVDAWADGPRPELTPLVAAPFVALAGVPGRRKRSPLAAAATTAALALPPLALAVGLDGTRLGDGALPASHGALALALAGLLAAGAALGAAAGARLAHGLAWSLCVPLPAVAATALALTDGGASPFAAAPLGWCVAGAAREGAALALGLGLVPLVAAAVALRARGDEE